MNIFAPTPDITSDSLTSDTQFFWLLCESFEYVPELNDHKYRSLTLFRTSTTVKQRLVQVQEDMRRQPNKMIIEAVTRWNSTFLMLERLCDFGEPVGEASASLKTDFSPRPASKYEAIKDLDLLQATVEVSSERRVSRSKVLLFMKMLLQYPVKT